MANIRIIRALFVFSALICSSSLVAGQYITIEKVDASSNFPVVTATLTIAGLKGADDDLLDGDAITVYEDGKKNPGPVTLKKQIKSENYLYLVFSIDSSKSISKKILGKIKSSANEMADCIGPNDKIAVYRFDDEVRLLIDFTGNTRKIIRNIKSIDRHGKKTLLYDSIYDSIELFDRVKQINKKIIVFTDGKDEGSSVSEEDIITFARNAGIPVYFICFKNSNNIRVMARISKLTGGKLIYSNNHNDVAGMYRTVMSVMKSSYSATYASTLKSDGLKHRLEFRLRYGDIRDRDTVFIHSDKMMSCSDFFKREHCVMSGLCLLFVVVLLIIILFLIIREKRLLRERQELEKTIAMQRAAGAIPTRENGVVSEQALQASKDAEAQYVNAWLFQKDGPEVGKRYQIKSIDFTIGSAKDNSVVLQDDLVSPHHARIKNINGSFHLFDMISDKGIYFNGRKMLRPRELHDWDEIKIGRIALIFRNAARIG